MSKECPVTRAHCRDPLCEDQPCLRERAGYESKDRWDELLKEFRNTPWQSYDSSKMGSQPIHIHVHYDNKEVSEQLHSINKKIDKIMATIEEVQQAVADLQATVDTTQAAIAAAIKTLEDQIAAGSAATPEQLQGIIDSLKAVQTDIASTPTA